MPHRLDHIKERYNSIRTRNLFVPNVTKPFKLSRSKIELYMRCPRCFYLDRKLGISQPPGYPFNLNLCVDKLLKKEFDLYREMSAQHPLMEKHNIDAIPFKHADLEKWRNALNFGLFFLHPFTNLIITGAVDDIWVNSSGELIVVDYKATSKTNAVSLDSGWQISYKRQMEIYQWLLRMNGFKVCNTGYFLYCNAISTRQSFNKRLEFDMQILPYTGNTDWIDDIIVRVHACLMSERIPKLSLFCDYCRYRSAAHEFE